MNYDNRISREPKYLEDGLGLHTGCTSHADLMHARKASQRFAFQRALLHLNARNTHERVAQSGNR